MNATNSNQYDPIKGFEALSLCAIAASSETQGVSPVGWEVMMASVAFSRLALTSTSILRLMPGNRLSSTVFGVQMCDLGAIGSLSRNLIETTLTMHYLLNPLQNDRERVLRRLVWEYHDAIERFKIMRSATPASQRLHELQDVSDQRRAQLLKNTEFLNLPRDLRKRIQRGEQAKLKANEEICDAAGVSRNFYASMFKYGSNHTHSSPYSFSLMNRLAPAQGLGFDAINIALIISAGFLAVGICGYLSVFPKQFERMTEDERRQLSLWLAVVKWDQNEVFSKLAN